MSDANTAGDASSTVLARRMSGDSLLLLVPPEAHLDDRVDVRHVAQELLFETMPPLEFAVVFSQSDRQHCGWQRIVPQSLIHDDPAQFGVVMDRVFSRQTHLMEQHALPWLLVVIDQCMMLPLVIQSDQFERLLIGGRNYRLCLVMLMKYETAVTFDVKHRVNIDNCASFRLAQPTASFGERFFGTGRRSTTANFHLPRS